MSTIERQQYLQKITQRLVTFTGVALALLALGLYGFISINSCEAPDACEEKSYLVLLVFISGLLGGFVSIQQRLPSIRLDELKVLSSSWISITLIPINGGIFALVIMLMFAGHIIQGQLFPVYPDTFPITDAKSFSSWLEKAYPENGIDIAKLLFWSFVSGFSERFVPQIIRRTSNEAIEEPNSKNPNKTN